MGKKHDGWSDTARGAYRVYQATQAFSNVQGSWDEFKSAMVELIVIAGIVAFLGLLAYLGN